MGGIASGVMGGHHKKTQVPSLPEPRGRAADMVPAAKRQRLPAVGKKVRAGIAALLASGKPLDELDVAAKAAGLSTYALRQALKRAEVRRYFDGEVLARLEAGVGANLNALEEVRDSGANDAARVKAAQVLEQMRLRGRDPARSGSAGPVLRPGLVIQINQVSTPAPERPAITVNEIEPAPELVEDPDFGPQPIRPEDR